MTDEKLEKMLRQSLVSEISDEEIKVDLVGRKEAKKEMSWIPVLRPILVSLICVVVLGVGGYIIPSWRSSEQELTVKNFEKQKDDAPKSEANSLLETKNQAEQFEKMQEELNDLKSIKVKLLPKRKMKEFSRKIYENYFRNKSADDQWATDDDGVNSIRYDKGEILENIDYGDDFVSYLGYLFGEDVIYDATEEEVIQKETEKLFKLLNLPYGNTENGYAIDKVVVNEDKSVQVHLKKYIEGKETTLAEDSLTEGLYPVENIELTFGNNQIIEIDMRKLTEVVDVQSYSEEVRVDTPQKARKLVDGYISDLGEYSVSADGKVHEIPDSVIETARISYVTEKEKDGTITLRPMAEFYEDIEHVYQVDLTTEKAEQVVWCSIPVLPE